MERHRIGRWLVAASLVLATGSSALAGVEDWELNEVLTDAGGDTAVRYIELKTTLGSCLFPSSRVVVYDRDGAATDTLQLVSATRCYQAGSYFLAATSAAAAHFNVSTDLQLAPNLPQDAAQLCFVSSATRYDCVRWGALNTAVVDFFGSADTSVVNPPSGARSLARVGTSHVVVDDWRELQPTPRGPNDGTPWSPPDAGPTPDAWPMSPDAGPAPDGRRLRDAGPAADADPQRYLDVDPAGGASCSCTGSEPRGGTTALLLIALAAACGLRPPSRRVAPTGAEG